MEGAWARKCGQSLPGACRQVVQAPQASRVVGRGHGLDSVLGEAWQESTRMLAVPLLQAVRKSFLLPGLPFPG